MSGFVYFLEGCSIGQVRQVMPSRGLGYVASPSLRMRDAMRGPGGAGGVVVADAGRVEPEQIGYFPDQQTWHRVPATEPGGEAWVGMMRSSVPGPADLVRAELVAGEDVRLGDEQLWHVPHAIDYHGGPGLDRTFELDAGGRWVSGPIVAKHRRLWDLAWEWRGVLDDLTAWGSEHTDAAGGPDLESYQDPRLELDWILARSVEVLQTNYVIGTVEASMLGLFVSGGRWTVLQALCDSRSFVAMMRMAVDREQKKTDAGPCTTPGEAAGS